MYYVYIIRKCNNNALYIGYTSNLKRRFKKHNSAQVKWILIYYEAYKARKDALLREKRVKYFGKALAQLKRRITLSLV